MEKFIQMIFTATDMPSCHIWSLCYANMFRYSFVLIVIVKIFSVHCLYDFIVYFKFIKPCILNFFVSKTQYPLHSVEASLCRFFPGHHCQDGWTSPWEKVKNMIICISGKKSSELSPGLSEKVKNMTIHKHCHTGNDDQNNQFLSPAICLALTHMGFFALGLLAPFPQMDQVTFNICTLLCTTIFYNNWMIFAK